MPIIEPKISPSQLAALLDAAFRTPHPLSFLDTVVVTLKTIERHEDAVAVAWIGCLYAEGEIELLMMLRSAWERGVEASPGAVAQDVARRHRAKRDLKDRRATIRR